MNKNRKMNDQLHLFPVNETPYTSLMVDDISSSFFIHRLSGERLKIVKLYGNHVAKCELNHEIILTKKPYLSTKTAICNIENLIPIV
jgi:hypothetical protein